MLRFDFKCPCDKVKEVKVKKYNDVVKCECGKVCEKLPSGFAMLGMDSIGRSGNKDD